MTPMASSDFGRMLSVGAIRFEDRFCASKKGGIGGGGWVHPGEPLTWQLPWLAREEPCRSHGSCLGWLEKSLAAHMAAAVAG